MTKKPLRNKPLKIPEHSTNEPLMQSPMVRSISKILHHLHHLHHLHGQLFNRYAQLVTVLRPLPAHAQDEQLPVPVPVLVLLPVIEAQFGLFLSEDAVEAGVEAQWLFLSEDAVEAGVEAESQYQPLGG